MHEMIEQLYEYVRPVWTHKWIVLACASVVCLLGWAVVALLPNQYRVRATIQVERSSLLQPLLKGITVESDIASEMAGLMRQTMLVPESLESIAREAGLDKAATTPEKLDRLVTQLETDIQISADKEKKGLYTVTYQYSDARITQRVVEVLINRFLDNIIKRIRVDSENSRQIIDEQIGAYRSNLEEAALRIKRFKQEHVDLVSEDGLTYYARLQEAKREYREALLTLQEAEQEVDAIRDERGLSASSKSSNDKNVILNPIDPIDAEMAEAEKALTELERKRYTNEHPDVIATKKTIEALREKKQRRASRPQTAETLRETSEQDLLSSGPAYQAWRTLLTRAEAKVAALRSRVAEYKRRLDELQEGMATMPQLEAELANLRREYVIQEDSYQKLVARREAATISEKVEKASDLKINMLEPPRVPVRPIGPNRVLFNTLVLLGGIGAGVGIALVVSLLNPTIYTQRDLEKFSDLPILGSVSVNTSLIKPASNVSYFVVLGSLVVILAVLNLLYIKHVAFLTDLAGSLTKHISFLP